MKNNKGFTLVEMLVVIAVIAMLSVSMGLSANKVARNAQISQYEDTIFNIFNAASVSLDMRVMGEGCSNKDDWDNLDNGQKISVSLQCLVGKGLLDKNIYETNNPLYKNKKFQEDDVVYVEKTSDEKKASISCGDNSIDMDNLYKYEKWGEC